MAGLDKRLGEKMEKKAGVKLYVAVEDRKRNEKAKLRAELRTEEKAACGEGRALLAEINLSKDELERWTVAVEHTTYIFTVLFCMARWPL